MGYPKINLLMRVVNIYICVCVDFQRGTHLFVDNHKATSEYRLIILVRVVNRDFVVTAQFQAYPFVRYGESIVRIWNRGIYGWFDVGYLQIFQETIGNIRSEQSFRDRPISFAVFYLV